MKKNAKKQIKATPKYDSQRETRVLLEEMNKGIKTIGEQHGSIVKKLEEHDKRFNKMESELNFVKMAVIDNSQHIKKLEAGQEEIKKKLDTVTTDHEQRLQKLEVA